MASATLLWTGDRSDAVVVSRIRLRDRLLAHCRARALDRALARGAAEDTRLGLSLRAGFITSRRSRESLANTLRRLARERKHSPSIVRAPLDVEAIDAGAPELEELASRLLAPGLVAARGVAQTRLLLSDGTGPLYSRLREGELESRVTAAIDSLDQLY